MEVNKFHVTKVGTMISAFLHGAPLKFQTIGVRLIEYIYAVKYQQHQFLFVVNDSRYVLCFLCWYIYI